ncbi:MAG: ThiF family adenylyltransferase [Myxococcales bacterium]|nr:ThiF family adenylyltransferase [Myxococcales bacterium]
MKAEGASVLMIGLGGLGAAAAPLLATSSRISRLTLLDDDRIDVTNLHRQPLYQVEDEGALKVEIARRFLLDRAAEADHPLAVEAIASRLLPESALELIRGHDLVVEGADNFATKFLALDASAISGVTCVQAGAVRWSGWALASSPGAGACMRCVFEDIPDDRVDTCADAGVIGPVVGVLGALEAALALRSLLVGDRDRRSEGELFAYDGLAGRIRQTRPKRRSGCPLCEGRIRSVEAERYVVACAPRS